ncbi:head-tail joining protein [Oharaeibacter diazotrophicus]|uniref:Uncharacterized protein n=1 Tax=Oharaeibacter diazotrophicus TaxID=1920512 RepID=A0A4R6RG99_9HYPH|nr:hypothetical protein [Oharaeibacter diazotrophicus]TDP85389.1 hypothetical protein EDD54_2242 [Oharaeibacter diazotrophicus]BBE74359.1 hypothetical protein OHA_1_03990 [Pleomorphomonas sp. SM30]GLS75948.1 hypothetical protein GCM10007904_12830 [Oharaeibacter diazotrophicus]
MSVAAAAVAHLDAQFALWARPASYVPPGGGAAVVCAIVVVRPDDLVGVGEMTLVRGAQILMVRASEVTPDEGGVFTRIHDGATFRVLGEPRHGADRALWRCGVR